MTDAPWSNDLAEQFDDAEIREQVDEFLRERVQPHITKLEQDAKPDRNAQKLWEAFQEDPEGAFKQVASELFGDATAEQIAAALVSQQDSQDTLVESNEDNQQSHEGITLDDLPPEVQEAVASRKQEESQQQYFAEIERLQQEHADELPKGEDGEAVLDVDLFHPFVVSANGDFDLAYDGYKKWSEKFSEVHGKPSEEPEGEQPPPVVDSTTQAAPGAAPPQVKTPATLDEAIDEFFAEQKSTAPIV